MDILDSYIINRAIILQIHCASFKLVFVIDYCKLSCSVFIKALIFFMHFTERQCGLGET